jgi:hypothetical protein
MAGVDAAYTEAGAGGTVLPLIRGANPTLEQAVDVFVPPKCPQTACERSFDNAVTRNRPSTWVSVVELMGFEPMTSCLPSKFRAIPLPAETENALVRWWNTSNTTAASAANGMGGVTPLSP